MDRYHRVKIAQPFFRQYPQVIPIFPEIFIDCNDLIAQTIDGLKFGVGVGEGFNVIQGGNDGVFIGSIEM